MNVFESYFTIFRRRIERCVQRDVSNIPTGNFDLLPEAREVDALIQRRFFRETYAPDALALFDIGKLRRCSR